MPDTNNFSLFYLSFTQQSGHHFGNDLGGFILKFLVFFLFFWITIFTSYCFLDFFLGLTDKHANFSIDFCCKRSANYLFYSLIS